MVDLEFMYPNLDTVLKPCELFENILTLPWSWNWNLPVKSEKRLNYNINNIHCQIDFFIELIRKIIRILITYLHVNLPFPMLFLKVCEFCIGSGICTGQVPI